MSDEILTGFPSFNAVHDAVHDLESFFWVLCWLVTKYRGPGLDNPAFHDVARMFFEASRERMGRSKRMIMCEENALENHILPHIQVFFDPLRTTVIKLAEILKGSYAARQFNGLHERFLEVLADAEKICRESKPPDYIVKEDTDPPTYVSLAHLTRNEQTRRQQDLLPPSLRDTKGQEETRKRKR